MLSWPAWALAAGCLAATAGAQTPCASTPAANCNAGESTATLPVSDSFGPAFSEWSSEGGAGSPDRLRTGKYVPVAGQRLIQADITITAEASGTLQVENRDPLNGCTANVRLIIDLAIEPFGGIGTLGQTALSFDRTFPRVLGPFDNIDDGLGTSGATVVINNALVPPEVRCFRITDPALLLSLTDSNPGDAITEEVEWIHQADDNSSSTGCAPQTFMSDPFAKITVAITYKVCTQTFEDCDNDDIPDDVDPDTSTCDCRMINRRNCGSLLLYPELDNRLGCLTLITITNACCDEIEEDTSVEFRFINKDTCLKDDRSFTLTPCDTLSFCTSSINPNPQQGYVYAYAKRSGPGRPPNQSGVPIVFNHLIGQELLIDGIESLSYSMNAVSFRGLGGDNDGDSEDEGDLNDDDGDGIRDLNGPSALALTGFGPEYEEAPDQILIPRFLGQDTGGNRPAVYTSELILIGLSGGAQFTTTVDFLVFNDNEEAISGQYEFRCWEKVELREFSSATLENFLDSLNTDDSDEILGHSDRNAGWIRIDGLVANSSGPESIDDPAIYAVLVERTGGYAAADLPWEECNQANGDLLPLSIFGDGPGSVAGDNQ